MIRYELATESDDKVLRDLLKNNGMTSWVDITMEREPSYFAGVNRVTRDFAVVARDGKQTVGMYSCSLQSVYLNGDACTQGYLGGLRVNLPYRNKIKVLQDGYASIQKLVPAGDHPFWFTSVATENTKARRLLERGLPRMPSYNLSGELVTLVLPVAQGRPLNLWRSATESDISAILDFYNGEASKFQYAPVLSESLIHYVGLENFLIYGEDNIQACLAIWDQSSFKQIVARAYQPMLQSVRPLYNLYARLTNRIRLPATGQPLSQSFLAFAAFSQKSMVHAVDLVRDVLHRCSTETAVIGLHDKHPLLRNLNILKPLIYRTCIYAVSFDNKPILDGRHVQPEVALL